MEIEMVMRYKRMSLEELDRNFGRDIRIWYESIQVGQNVAMYRTGFMSCRTKYTPVTVTAVHEDGAIEVGGVSEIEGRKFYYGELLTPYESNEVTGICPLDQKVLDSIEINGLIIEMKAVDWDRTPIEKLREVRKIIYG